MGADVADQFMTTRLTVTIVCALSLVLSNIHVVITLEAKCFQWYNVYFSL